MRPRSLGLLLLWLNINTVHCTFHLFVFLGQDGNNLFFFIALNLVLVLSEHRVDDKDLLLFESFIDVVFLRDT